jgi:hypothetical protein
MMLQLDAYEKQTNKQKAIHRATKQKIKQLHEINKFHNRTFFFLLK